MGNDAGKGDAPRPYDRKKWEAGWAAYEKGKKEITPLDCELNIQCQNCSFADQCYKEPSDD